MTLITATLAATVGLAEAQVGYTGTVTDFSPPDQRADGLVVELDALGNGFAVWTANSAVWAAQRAAGARAWSDPVALHNPSAPSSSPGDLDIAVDDQGNAVVVWWRHHPTPPQVVGGIVEHAYFFAESNAWTQAANVPGAVDALYPAVVMDRQRRVTVTWHESVLDTTFLIKAAHYIPGRLPDPWIAERTIGGSGNSASASEEGLVVDRDGLVTAIWDFHNSDPNSPHSVVAARYNPVSNSWSDDMVLELGEVGGSRLAADTAGNVLAVWSQYVAANTQLRFARFDRAVAGWSVAASITGSASATNARIATLPGGDALAIWSSRTSTGEGVVVARYLLAVGVWSSPISLSPVGRDTDASDLETDSFGNAFAVWRRADAGLEFALVARYSATTGAWSAPRDLADLEDGENVQVALDAAGNAVFGWDFEGDTTDIEKVQWTEWLGVPSAPTITAVSSRDRSLLVGFTPPPTSEPAFAPTHYEYRLVNVSHLGWIGGTPPFTSSPITIGSLTNGVMYTVQVRAWNAAGAGLPSVEGAGTPGEGLLAPTELRLAALNGNTVTLAWHYVTGSVAPTAFEVEGGLNPGETLASVRTSAAATTFTSNVPNGAFYVRVRAVSATTRSGPSNEIRIFVNVPAPPEAPQNLAGSASLFDLHLTWRRPTGGGAIDRFILDVSGGLSGSLFLPGDAETFTYSGVPAGTYTFTLRAQNATGVSASSNPVTLLFPGGCPVPNAPYGLVAQVVRRDVTLFWSRPNGGGIPTRYDIEAGALPFQTFVIATVGSSSNMMTATNVPSGTYYVRVRAANVCGRSEPTDAIEVRVPITVP